MFTSLDSVVRMLSGPGVMRRFFVANYSTYFSAVKFWEKVRRDSPGIGRAVLVPAFELYNALKSPQTPRWAKAVALGALGYFISPLDAVPDVIPAAGFVDDLLALMMAIQAIKQFVTPTVARDAQADVENLLQAVIGRTRLKYVAVPCARIAASLCRRRAGR